MQHLVLIGDSILDNAAYTAGGPAVITHVQGQLPAGWRASLVAVDGSITEDIYAQLQQIPADATHLLLSVGGNNALSCLAILETPVDSTAEALLLLSEMARDFELAYRTMLQACLAVGLELVVCTVYNGNFPDSNYQQRAAVALTVFNDVILRIATEYRLTVIELRLICTAPDDYANPIEPSATGGAKIAQAIVKAVTEPAHAARGATVVF